MKGPGATLVQRSCCHADELRLVGRQVKERSLQMTLSLVLRKTKAASGISVKKKKDGNAVIERVGAGGNKSYEMHLFQSCEAPQHIEALH